MRVSFGTGNQPAEVDAFLASLATHVTELRALATAAS
jgi:cysteine sulfinate desulfinase/cysteine desulfurase-like protein